MSVFFTADSHWNHANIIKYCNRPFQSVDEMNRTIIDNINAKVSSKDTLYFLGDFAFGPMAPFREQINCGNIVLIRGNHDRQIDRKLFSSINDIAEYKNNGLNIVLCHYSFRVWNKSCHDSFHLFGHSHGTLKIDEGSLSMDVGVDCNNFHPYSLDEIVKIMEYKKSTRGANHE